MVLGIKKPPKGKKTVTAVKYTNKKGHVAYKGSSSLKSTQILVGMKSKFDFGPLVTVKWFEIYTNNIFSIESKSLRIYPVRFAGQIVRCLSTMFRSTGAIPEPDFPPVSGLSKRQMLWHVLTNSNASLSQQLRLDSSTLPCAAQVDTSRPFIEIFQEMTCDDWWEEDAALKSVYRYLRGCKDLHVKIYISHLSTGPFCLLKFDTI